MSTAQPLPDPGGISKSRAWRILIDGDSSLAIDLAAEVRRGHQVVVSRPAACGLVMALARDSVANQPFCLGEVLVTECTVRVNDQPGYGIVTGEQPDLATALAVLDAAWAAGLPEVAGWEERLLAGERAIAAARDETYRRLAGSRVRFETMEDYK